MPEMTDFERIVERVRRLQRLAQSPNPHEAAAATAKADELIAAHHLGLVLGVLDNFEALRRRNAEMDAWLKSRGVRP